MEAEGDCGPETLWLAMRRQHAEVCALRREVAGCREELGTLVECLADTGNLLPARLPVTLHRRNFRAVLAAHPLHSTARLATVLQADGIAVTVGLYSGWPAARAAVVASRAAGAAAGCIGQTFRDLFASRIYVCGGSIDGVEVLDTVECFCTASRTWEALPRMNERRGDASAHVIAGQLYVCGGSNGSASQNSAQNSVLNSVERLNPCTGTWELMPSMLFARRGAAAGVIQGKLYVCGGYDATEQALDLSECFDPCTSSVWEALPLMLEPRAQPSAGVVDGRLYVCGGRGGGVWAQLSSAEVFDAAEGGWQALPPMLEPRSGASAAPVAMKLFVCGGMGNSVLSSVESLDTQSGTWEAAPPTSVPRYEAGAVAAAGLLYVFGGSHGWQHLASAECFDPASGVWSPLPPMSERRMSPAVAAALA